MTACSHHGLRTRHCRVHGRCTLPPNATAKSCPMSAPMKGAMIKAAFVRSGRAQGGNLPMDQGSKSGLLGRRVLREDVGVLLVGSSLDERAFELVPGALRNRRRLGVIDQVEICGEGFWRAGLDQILDH